MKDPRDPFVAVRPEADPWLSLNPGILDGPTDASLHRAQVAQQAERVQAITAVLERESADLYRQQTLDSIESERLADSLPAHLSRQDRRDAAAVAIRLHDPRWQQVSRYEAATALLLALRNSQKAHGWYLSEAETRRLADHLAGVAHVARFKVWTGQIAVHARTWARAALGILNLTEER